LVAGCAATPPREQPPPPDLYDEAWYQSAPDGQRYRIDPGASRIWVTVRRAGWLKFLGHNHVLVNSGIEGWAWIDAQHSVGRADIRIDVREFVVDPEGLRLEYGPEFGAQPSAGAIAATRRNLLGPRALDVASYPYLTGRAEVIERIDARRVRLAMSLVVKSHLWQGVVEAELRETPDCLSSECVSPGCLSSDCETPDCSSPASSSPASSSPASFSIVAELPVDHRDLGLSPIGVYAGAISVAQRLIVRLELTARQTSAEGHAELPVTRAQPDAARSCNAPQTQDSRLAVPAGHPHS
jgi:hypothetical protein